MKFTFLPWLCMICLNGCSMPSDRSIAQSESVTRDALFQKRLECGKLLANISGSSLDRTPLKQYLAEKSYESKVDGGGQIVDFNPVVFYSPTLNTCLFLQRHDLIGRTLATNEHYRTETVELEDLLTGEDVQSADFDVHENSHEADKFADDLLKKYGFNNAVLQAAESNRPQSRRGQGKGD